MRHPGGDDRLAADLSVPDVFVRPFQRDGTAELDVGGPPHLTHPTGPDPLLEPVALRDHHITPLGKDINAAGVTCRPGLSYRHRREFGPEAVHAMCVIRAAPLVRWSPVLAVGGIACGLAGLCLWWVRLP
jgi:hypothetical protein